MPREEENALDYATFIRKCDIGWCMKLGIRQAIYDYRHVAAKQNVGSTFDNICDRRDKVVVFIRALKKHAETCKTCDIEFHDKHEFVELSSVLYNR